MLTYHEIKETCEDRIEQLFQEMDRCQDIANLTNNFQEENACYERIEELRREVSEIKDYLYVAKANFQRKNKSK